MEYTFFGIPIVGIFCVTTVNPPGIAINLLGGEVVQLPYTTYQQIRAALNLPDIVCGES